MPAEPAHPPTADAAADAPLAPKLAPHAGTEWVGLFLFGVGLLGILRKGLHRHYTLWGVPLDQIDLALLVLGGCMMLLASPWAPWREARGGFWRWAAWLRFATAGGALGFLVGWALR